MKRLINEKYESYNDEGGAFDEELYKTLDPIIKKWVKNGFSTIDMEYIGTQVVSIICTYERTKVAMEIKKKERII